MQPLYDPSESSHHEGFVYLLCHSVRQDASLHHECLRCIRTPTTSAQLCSSMKHAPKVTCIWTAIVCMFKQVLLKAMWHQLRGIQF